MEPAERLSDEVQLALAHTPERLRAPLRVAFELDQRLARIVAATTEPMLGQMRLAWWRETLGKPHEERPKGDAVLDSVGDHWSGREEALVRLVDGWEVLITAEHLNGSELKAFASGRSAPAIDLLGQDDERQGEAVQAAMARYVFADLASGVSDERERKLAIEYGLGRSRPPVRLGRAARGIAVLDALARRSLKRGGRPMMEGRGAALVAARAAIIGR